MPTDVIREYCEGGNVTFNRVSCSFYTPATTECVLLKSQDMAQFWEVCRYRPIELIYRYADCCTRQLTKQYSCPLQVEYAGKRQAGEVEDVDFSAIITRLQGATLTAKTTLIAWCGYVKKTVYLEIRSYMVNRGFLPERNDCGHCQQLTRRSETYICLQTGETRKRDDPACPDFTPDVITYVSADWESESIQAALHEIRQSEAYQQSRIPMIIKLLRQRYEQAQPESKTRERYARQYEVFRYLTALLEHNTPKEEAKHLLAKVHHVNKKTIERDLTEIEKFLSTHNVFKNVASPTLDSEGGVSQ